MMNYRHPTQTEQNTVARICETVGAVEILRVISAHIRHAHPDLTTGDGLAARLNAVASELAAQQMKRPDSTGEPSAARLHRTIKEAYEALRVGQAIYVESTKGSGRVTAVGRKWIHLWGGKRCQACHVFHWWMG